MSFKDNLKVELSYQDIHIKELAKRTGISANTLGNYLTGHNSIPNAESAFKIAQALNVSVEYLVTGKHPKHANLSGHPLIKEILTLISQFDMIDLQAVHGLVLALKKRYE